MKTKHKYRMLREGERIKPTDQVFFYGRWRPAKGFYVRLVRPWEVSLFRRRLPTTHPSLG